jgi:hypothetical protein
MSEYDKQDKELVVDKMLKAYRKLVHYRGHNAGTYNTRLFEFNKDRVDLMRLMDTLQQRIATLEAQLRWIPVEERLPEDGEPVLTIYCTKGALSGTTIRARVIDKDFDSRVVWYDTEAGHWVKENNITHWMPLPNPPEEKAND